MHRDLVRHDDEEAARAASWVGCTFTNTFLNVENPAPGPAAFFLTKEVDAGKLGLPASCTPSSPRGLPAVWRLCSRRRNVVKVCQAVSSHLFSTKYQVFRFWKSRSVEKRSGDVLAFPGFPVVMRKPTLGDESASNNLQRDVSIPYVNEHFWQSEMFGEMNIFRDDETYVVELFFVSCLFRFK